MRCDGLRVVTVLGVFGWSQKLVAALQVAAPAERTCLLLYLPPSDTLLYNLLTFFFSILPPILSGFLVSRIPLYYIVEYSSVYISIYYYGYQSP